MQFRPPIALRTDLSGITTELWEIQVFSPADGALILHSRVVFGTVYGDMHNISWDQP